jgi:DNA-directed RNA polymerase subunit L
MTGDAPSRFKILRCEDNGRCATYELDDEDHTLGNALRHMILKNPEVKFCGYALPHPNERKINIQVQVRSGEAIDALEKGLRDLLELNSIVKEKVLEAKERFGPVELVDTDEEQELPEIDDEELERGEDELMPEHEHQETNPTEPPAQSEQSTAGNQAPMVSEETW